MASLIGQRIRELRTKAGLTQTDLAKGIVTPSMISQIEAGKAQPSPSLLKKLATRLDVSEPELFVEKSLDVSIRARLRVLRICAAQGLHEEAQSLAREVEAESAEHWQIPYARAMAAMHGREWVDAAVHTRQAQRSAAAEQQTDVLPELYTMEGDIYLASGDPALALHAYRQARIAMHAQQSPGVVDDVALTLHFVHAFSQLNDAASASRYIDEAAKQMAPKEYARDAARREALCAFQALSAPDEGHATRAAGQAAALQEIARWVDASAATCVALADQFAQAGDLSRATEQLEKCRGLRESDWSIAVRSQALFVEADVKLQQNRPDDWAALIEAALALQPEVPCVARATSLLLAADAAIRIGQSALACRIARAARDEATPLQRPDIEARAVILCRRLGEE